MTSRRAFLASLAAVFVADPERLLFVPGKKLISIPKPAIKPFITRKQVALMQCNAGYSAGKSWAQAMYLRAALEQGKSVVVAKTEADKVLYVSGTDWLREYDMRVPFKQRTFGEWPQEADR